MSASKQILSKILKWRINRLTRKIDQFPKGIDDEILDDMTEGRMFSDVGREHTPGWIKRQYGKLDVKRRKYILQYIKLNHDFGKEVFIKSCE